MSNPTVIPLRQPEAIDDPLTQVLRSGARELLAKAIEAEVEEFVSAYDRFPFAFPGLKFTRANRAISQFLKAPL